MRGVETGQRVGMRPRELLKQEQEREREREGRDTQLTSSLCLTILQWIKQREGKSR